MFKGQPLVQGSSPAVDSPDYSGPIVSAYDVYLVSSGLNNRVVTPPTVGVAYSFAQGLNNNAILKHTGVSECICRAVRPDLSTSTPYWVLIWTQLKVFQYGAFSGSYSTQIVNEL